MNTRLQDLIRLLQYQRDLQYDDTLSDEEFYYIDERLSNEIANNYTKEEIEEAELLI